MDFRYEQLPDLFFYCGLIDHNEKGCCKRKLDVAANCLMVGQYGMWMKAGTIRVFNTEKEAIQAKVDRLIAIDNQEGDMDKETTNQVKQYVGLNIAGNGTTLLGGNEGGKELLLVGNTGAKELLGSGENLKENIGGKGREKHGEIRGSKMEGI